MRSAKYVQPLGIIGQEGVGIIVAKIRYVVDLNPVLNAALGPNLKKICEQWG